MLLSMQEHRNSMQMKAEKVRRIMCIGESTTADALGNNPYPRQLEKILNNSSSDTRFEVINKGIPAAFTDTIVSRCAGDIEKYQPDIITVMMGVNDGGGTLINTDRRQDTLIRNLRVYKLAKAFLVYTQQHVINEAAQKRERYGFDSKDGDRNDLLGFENMVNYKQNKKAIDDLLSKLQKNNAKIPGGALKCITGNPANLEMYKEREIIVYSKEYFAEIESFYNGLIALFPHNADIFYSFGVFYSEAGLDDSALKMFYKVIDLNPEHEWAYLDIGWEYFDRGDFKKAKEMFQKTIALNPSIRDAYEGLGRIGIAEKDYEYAKTNFIYSERLFYSARTIENFKRIAQIANEKGIQLVCIQYPMRSIRPLQEILSSYSGVVFVDNEKSFKDAVLKEGYNEYFTDRFSGDFGHCTEKGNKLIAENIARKIL